MLDVGTAIAFTTLAGAGVGYIIRVETRLSSNASDIEAAAALAVERHNDLKDRLNQLDRKIDKLLLIERASRDVIASD